MLLSTRLLLGPDIGFGERKTWETGQGDGEEDGEDLVGEDLQVMKEMWLGAAVFGRRGRMRGREREKLGECINLGYLSVFRTVMAGGERRHGRLRTVRDLAWASRECLERCVASQLLQLVTH